ncbi:MAG: hypothetical protein IJN83_04045 [Clostridia bacterium]|nr:hypothetical protein [Clostridia bacterium]
MRKKEIRAKSSGNLFGHICVDDVVSQLVWAYCSGDVIRYQLPMDDFLALVFDAAADFAGEEGLQEMIAAAQARRTLRKVS